MDEAVLPTSWMLNTSPDNCGHFEAQEANLSGQEDVSGGLS